MTTLSFKDFSFSYPETSTNALTSITGEFTRGSFTAVIGASGSGKTTLLRHLKPALTPRGTMSGAVTCDDVAVDALSAYDAAFKIGYVMQNSDDQIVTDKVWHELAYGLENAGTDPAVMRVRVAEMADYFGIESWFHADVTTLSGGQKQLLNLASIMACQPEVLVLDEPTSQLDPIAAADFLATVHRINRELGTTVIMTEHRLENVLPVADGVWVLDAGKLIARTSPRALGDVLAAQAPALFEAIPAPMRIFYGTRSDVGAEGNSREHVGREVAPLTVREGRTWIEAAFELESQGRPSVQEDLARLEKEQSIVAKADQARPVVEMKEVHFRYTKDAPDVLRGTDVSIAPGQFYTLLGGNGAGKSTFLRVMCGLEKPYAGRVLIKGKPLAKMSVSERYTRNLALLPQDPTTLFVHKTVAEELADMRRRDEPEAEFTQRVDALCARLGLEGLDDRHPFDLSGGQQQRLGLAMVLLTQPSILALDEPTKGLDPAAKHELGELLTGLVAEGLSLVVVSHDVEFCARWADTVGLFFDGGVVAQTSPRQLFSANGFYTTAANRMCRSVFETAITAEEVIALCDANHFSH